MDLSLVIVSFQVRDLLERCLASLTRRMIPPTVEIIVVDNASTDGSVAMVHEKFPSAVLIENKENLGFSRANNQGLKIAQGRYWMLLNPDTEIEPNGADPLQQLVSFMDEHPRAGVCGPGLFDSDGSRQHSAFRFPSLAQIYMDLYPVNWRLRESRLNGRYPKAWYERGEPFQIDHPLGAALLVRPAAVKQVGLLDEDYFIYAEEVDWCIRIKRAGWQIWCVPSARIIHHEARSTRQFRDKMILELWKARLILFRKNYSGTFNLAARGLIRRGMKRALGETRASAARGEIQRDEMERRVATFETVISLSK